MPPRCAASRSSMHPRIAPAITAPAAESSQDDSRSHCPPNHDRFDRPGKSPRGIPGVRLCRHRSKRRSCDAVRGGEHANGNSFGGSPPRMEDATPTIPQGAQMARPASSEPPSRTAATSLGPLHHAPSGPSPARPPLSRWLHSVQRPGRVAPFGSSRARANSRKCQSRLGRRPGKPGRNLCIMYGNPSFARFPS